LPFISVELYLHSDLRSPPSAICYLTSGGLFVFWSFSLLVAEATCLAPLGCLLVRGYAAPRAPL